MATFPANTPRTRRRLSGPTPIVTPAAPLTQYGVAALGNPFAPAAAIIPSTALAAYNLPTVPTLASLYGASAMTYTTVTPAAPVALMYPSTTPTYPSPTSATTPAVAAQPVAVVPVNTSVATATTQAVVTQAVPTTAAANYRDWVSRRLVLLFELPLLIWAATLPKQSLLAIAVLGLWVPIFVFVWIEMIRTGLRCFLPLMLWVAVGCFGVSTTTAAPLGRAALSFPFNQQPRSPNMQALAARKHWVYFVYIVATGACAAWIFISAILAIAENARLSRILFADPI
ncbi:hypothetical protein BJ546DRAFT_1059704 [Cryomyces antarcticus]